MSSSYGPGRYDSEYEQKGHDYPIGYVRWTENRNMQSFVDLLFHKRLDISSLISHTIKLEDSINAYDMILSKNEKFSGIIIEYDKNQKPKKKIQNSKKSYDPDNVNLGVIGAGTFAQGFLLPNMKEKCNFIGIATGKGHTAKYVGEKYKFEYLSDNADDIINDKNINTIMIATRNHLHAQYVLKSFTSSKNVFVEKPLAINMQQLDELYNLYHKESFQKQLMIGYNRRYAPSIKKMISELPKNQKMSIIIRVNNTELPIDHWTNDPDVGGGRIVSDACHFIDLSMFLTKSNIKSISAESIKDVDNLNNTVVINLKFKNGSIASINYFSNGNKSLSKEYIEVYCDGTVAILDDFKTLTFHGKKEKKIKYKTKDKGHNNCLNVFLNSIKSGKPCPMTFEEMYLTTLATLKINSSIAENRKITL